MDLKKKYFEKGYITVQDLVNYCNEYNLKLNEVSIQTFDPQWGSYDYQDFLETDGTHVFIGDSNIFGKE